MQGKFNFLLRCYMYGFQSCTWKGTFSTFFRWMDRHTWETTNQLTSLGSHRLAILTKTPFVILQPRQPNPDWRYSASLRAGMHRYVFPSFLHSEVTLTLYGLINYVSTGWKQLSKLRSFRHFAREMQLFLSLCLFLETLEVVSAKCLSSVGKWVSCKIIYFLLYTFIRISIRK